MPDVKTILLGAGLLGAVLLLAAFDLNRTSVQRLMGGPESYSGVFNVVHQLRFDLHGRALAVREIANINGPVLDCPVYASRFRNDDLERQPRRAFKVGALAFAAQTDRGGWEVTLYACGPTRRFKSDKGIAGEGPERAADLLGIDRAALIGRAVETLKANGIDVGGVPPALAARAPLVGAIPRATMVEGLYEVTVGLDGTIQRAAASNEYTVAGRCAEGIASWRAQTAAPTPPRPGRVAWPLPPDAVVVYEPPARNGVPHGWSVEIIRCAPYVPVGSLEPEKLVTALGIDPADYAARAVAAVRERGHDPEQPPTP